MEKHHHSISYLVFLVTMLICSSCDEESPVETVLQGTVRNMLDDEIIHPAFLILGDELLTITDEHGTYEITSLDPGTYSLLCSAIHFGDKTMQVEVEHGNTVSYDLLLSPDNSKGRVYGELHDQMLYNESLIANLSMAGWNGKELFDGVSGATIQTMTFGYDLPAAEIYIGDSLYSVTDGFGQYWFDIQSGTYPLMVSIPGWADSMRVIRVEPDSSIFVNFILSKQ